MSVTTQDTTRTITTTAAPEAPRVVPEPRHSSRRLIALVGGLAVVTVATVGSWAYLAGRPAPAPDTSWTSAYAPGSTTFGEQVPVAPWTQAYGPGSAVQSEQVPSVAGSGWTSAYGPGSAVQQEQVPSVAGSGWTSAYGPGSAVQQEQVPATSQRPTRTTPSTGTSDSGYGPGSATYNEQVPRG